MSLRDSLRSAALGGALLMLSSAGCTESEPRHVVPPERPPARRAASANALLSGTVGSQTLLVNVEPQLLRGYGLVVGLDGTGSGDCPTVIRDYLIDFMTKQIGPQGADRTPRQTPGELIDSPNTAVVEVIGQVPSGARRGAHFDLFVRALPGTATQSIEGGLLLPAQLRYFDRSASGSGLIAGSVLAEACGPIFVDPGDAGAEPGVVGDPRRGMVLGGGRTLEERPVRLRLMQSSYQLAKGIEKRINERFGQSPKVAQAESRGYVQLSTPPAYAREPDHFRELAVYVYLDNTPEYMKRKWQELTQAAGGGTAPPEPLSLAWEAAGKTALPHLQSLYGTADARLRYAAVRAGARLGDPLAMPLLGDIAADPHDAQRRAAIAELGEVESPQAALKLVSLLDDDKAEIRIAAYEALLQHNHPGIHSVPFRHILDQAQLNFVLDVVECNGPPLIYVRRSRLPRLAVFGRQVPVMPPVFYTHPEDNVTLVTTDGADDVRVFTKLRGHLSDEILVPPNAVALITALGDVPLRDDAEKMRGIGLPYSRVVEVVARLCAEKVIPAKLVFEPLGPVQWVEPAERPGRPETEDAAPPAPAEEQKPAAERKES